jgi:outer membrane biosynthesis protein TonB
MALEMFEMKTQEGRLIPVIGINSLLAEIRKLNVNTDRNEKVMLASIEQLLMVQTGELTEADFKTGEPIPPEPTPPPQEPVPPEPEIQGEVPKPTKPEPKAKKKDEPPTGGKLELDDDEFPLR